MESKVRKKRLLFKYLIMIAILGSLKLNSQVIYTDVNPDVWDYNIPIDLDNDSSPEFIININNAWYYYANVQSVSGEVLMGNEYYCGSLFAQALNTSDIIGSNQGTWLECDQPDNDIGGNLVDFIIDCGNPNYYPYGPWMNAQDKYLGLRFIKNGNIHYGWARLTMPYQSQAFLKDYAYNVTANQPIAAGQTILSLEDFNESQVKLAVYNNLIKVFDLNRDTLYSLYSISGQTMLQGKLRKSSSEIEIQSLSQGFYIIELMDTNFNKRLRKKIVVN